MCNIKRVCLNNFTDLNRKLLEAMADTSLPTPEALAHLTGKGSDMKFPPAITAPGDGGKFDFNGDVLALPGNTFICHIDQQSDFYRALSRLQDAIRALPQAHSITFLPKPSFHMTIFGGVIGDPPGQDGWPVDITKGASLASITSRWAEQLNAIEELGGFAVRPTHLRAPYSVSMQGASDKDAAALLDARQRLQRLTGLVRGDVQSYEFHVTLGYLVKWMDVDEALRLVEAAGQLFNEHMPLSDSVELGHVEFCTFENMYRFKRVNK